MGVLLLAFAAVGAVAHAQETAPENGGVLELRFVPTKNAQLAIWIERADGLFMGTLRLTESVSLRGIGNRPGASTMNSGFHWPYGRREGVLPLWATRRAAAPGAQPFRRVIFQDRLNEGLASKTANDQSTDHYFCLTFDEKDSRKDALDAMSCATVFSSDKGRFINENDTARGYAEPYQVSEQDPGSMRPLSLQSLYPPRRDELPCNDNDTCFDHPDLASFGAHAREVMPEIDAVTMATPVGHQLQQILYPVPAEWQPGAYRACVEINVEGDYNDAFNDRTLPTPFKPEDTWDIYALTFGYPYRGQPSVLYCVDFELGGEEERSFASASPLGSTGTWDVNDASFGQLHTMDGISDDPSSAPGSGGDRLLRMDDGSRVWVHVKPANSCANDTPPSAVTALESSANGKRLHAHEWARLRFAAAADDFGVQRYDVRISTAPIVDDASFMAAMPAKAASLAAPELRVPTDVAAGETISVEFGGMIAETHYFIAVRAIDSCARPGPIASTELTTPAREFATVTPCFVATAAWGSPLAEEIGALRRLRDRDLLSNELGRALVGGYYRLGPELAGVIREHAWMRALARSALAPLV
ncbi:MAG TPA: CFI-box-CTERM domain-containing protein, partial [Polyangiales bacterium]|nr:CFI-box-CTERM domain-containing protein [Polyangiales bacterium]